ncbi:MAG: dockerin type I repeat-containing protein [Gammaproteobacteria bacterium]|nr:dockerin type I repeat-containing protein [Gammaproteobacteria bacterium]
MQCSRPVRAFIYTTVGLGACVLLLAAFTGGRTDKALSDPEIVASQSANDPNFRKLDETSGIAIAGFRDEKGYPLLWAQNEKTSRITLIATRQADSLYVGSIAMPGRRTRDAEDIAVVHDQGKGTIYLADTGTNRKDVPVCIHIEHQKEDPSQCRILDYFLPRSGKPESTHAKAEAECISRGDDWIWLPESNRVDAGVHPSIRRMPEPSYAQALLGKLVADAATIEFEYPRTCDGKPCRGLAFGDIGTAPAYNTEAMAVVVEPDHSHTAYLFTKAPPSLSKALFKQHSVSCGFEGDLVSEVFRLRHVDSLAPVRLQLAEYVATLDLARNTLREETDERWSVTSANFLQISDSQGLLLLRTKGHALKWPVGLVRGMRGAPTFDMAAALKQPPLPATAPRKHNKKGVSRKNQEAVAQWDESTLYYMGECKGMSACSVARVHDDHPYLPGDVDGNGRVDREDAADLKRFIGGEIGLYCKAAADADGDGRLTQADLDYLKNHIDGRGPAPRRSGTGAPGGKALACGYYRFAGGNH